MSATDTRSIEACKHCRCAGPNECAGALEALRERAETAEARLNSITGMERQRLAELKFKEGFDACRKEEKSLTPKAKAYRDALREAHDALTELVDIINGHLDEGNRLDSFTLQPAKAAITKAEAVLR